MVRISMFFLSDTIFLQLTQNSSLRGHTGKFLGSRLMQKSPCPGNLSVSTAARNRMVATGSQALSLSLFQLPSVFFCFLLALLRHVASSSETTRTLYNQKL